MIAYSDRSNLLCSFRILITPKKVVLREYFEWNISHFGRDLYRNDKTILVVFMFSRDYNNMTSFTICI